MKKPNLKVTVDFAHVALMCDNPITFSDILRYLNGVSDEGLQELCEKTAVHNILSGTKMCYD